jgi:cyclohexyl-isocyanide hydratase
MIKTLNIGVLVYDGVEPADYVNPMAVFEKTNDYIEHKNTIRLVSQDGANVSASNRTLVGPAASFREAGDINVLIVPGGFGVIAAIKDERIVGFVRDRWADPGLLHILSVCSGSYLLAEAGLLDGNTLRSLSSTARPSSPTGAGSSPRARFSRESRRPIG